MSATIESETKEYICVLEEYNDMRVEWETSREHLLKLYMERMLDCLDKFPNAKKYDKLSDEVIGENPSEHYQFFFKNAWVKLISQGKISYDAKTKEVYLAK